MFFFVSSIILCAVYDFCNFCDSRAVCESRDFYDRFFGFVISVGVRDFCYFLCYLLSWVLSVVFVISVVSVLCVISVISVFFFVFQ